MTHNLGRGDAPFSFSIIGSSIISPIGSVFPRIHSLRFALFFCLLALLFTCATSAEPQFTDNNDNVARGLVADAVVAS
jgi:hypothetical protein